MLDYIPIPLLLSWHYITSCAEHLISAVTWHLLNSLCLNYYTLLATEINLNVKVNPIIRVAFAFMGEFILKVTWRLKTGFEVNSDFTSKFRITVTQTIISMANSRLVIYSKVIVVLRITSSFITKLNFTFGINILVIKSILY